MKCIHSKCDLKRAGMLIRHFWDFGSRAGSLNTPDVRFILLELPRRRIYVPVQHRKRKRRLFGRGAMTGEVLRLRREGTVVSPRNCCPKQQRVGGGWGKGGEASRKNPSAGEERRRGPERKSAERGAEVTAALGRNQRTLGPRMRRGEAAGQLETGT